MAEPNTVETNNEPTLDQFNDSTPAAKPAASEPATADANSTTAASAAKQPGQQPAGQAAQPQTAQTPADPYDSVMDGIQYPC